MGNCFSISIINYDGKLACVQFTVKGIAVKLHIFYPGPRFDARYPLIYRDDLFRRARYPYLPRIKNDLFLLPAIRKVHRIDGNFLPTDLRRQQRGDLVY